MVDVKSESEADVKAVTSFLVGDPFKLTWSHWTSKENHKQVRDIHKSIIRLNSVSSYLFVDEFFLYSLRNWVDYGLAPCRDDKVWYFLSSKVQDKYKCPPDTFNYAKISNEVQQHIWILKGDRKERLAHAKKKIKIVNDLIKKSSDESVTKALQQELSLFKTAYECLSATFDKSGRFDVIEDIVNQSDSMLQPEYRSLYKAMIKYASELIVDLCECKKKKSIPAKELGDILFPYFFAGDATGDTYDLWMGESCMPFFTCEHNDIDLFGTYCMMSEAGPSEVDYSILFLSLFILMESEEFKTNRKSYFSGNYMVSSQSTKIEDICIFLIHIAAGSLLAQLEAKSEKNNSRSKKSK
ncbi:MAG: hypothetical protein LBP59_05245 [Planctomycetaceae bacterium]|jgi:hypothetical protein|nr:hypothetical protein [Planctomycetaceae bacterium]